MFQSASAIVEGVMVDNLNPHQTWDELAGPLSIALTVNRVRAKLRPKEPRDLQFEVTVAHLST